MPGFDYTVSIVQRLNSHSSYSRSRNTRQTFPLHSSCSDCLLLSVKIRVQTTDRVRLNSTIYLIVFEAAILQNSVQQCGSYQSSWRALVNARILCYQMNWHTATYRHSL